MACICRPSKGSCFKGLGCDLAQRHDLGRPQTGPALLQQPSAPSPSNGTATASGSLAGTQRYSVGIETPRLATNSLGGVPWLRTLRAERILESVMTRLRPPTLPVRGQPVGLLWVRPTLYRHLTPRPGEHPKLNEASSVGHGKSTTLLSCHLVSRLRSPEAMLIHPSTQMGFSHLTVNRCKQSRTP